MAGMPLFDHAGREKLTRSAGGGQRAGGAEELRSNRRLLFFFLNDFSHKIRYFSHKFAK